VDKYAVAKKFSESCWKILFYSISEYWGLKVLIEGQWFADTALLWKDYPHPFSAEVRSYYLFELGFYLHALVCQFIMETKRSDHWQMVLHHVTTLGLVSYSLVCGVFRVGSVILVLHDISDLLFEIGKIMIYLGYEFISNCILGVMISSWIICRVTLFPLKIIRSAMFESWVEFDLTERQVYLSLYGFVGALWILLVLNIYWLSLMLRMAYRILRGMFFNQPVPTYTQKAYHHGSDEAR